MSIKKKYRYEDQTKQPGYENRKKRSAFFHKVRAEIMRQLKAHDPALFERLKAGAEDKIKKAND